MYNNIALLIGHLVGDYIFQNDWMAKNKSEKSGKGVAICHVHSIVYAVCVTTFVVLGGWRFNDDLFSSIVAVFLIAHACHFPIDHYGLAGKWMKWFGQTLPDKLEKISVKALPDVKAGPDNTIDISFQIPDRTEEVYIGLRQYFWAPVYIAVDNAMHLVLMWLLLSWLGD